MKIDLSALIKQWVVSGWLKLVGWQASVANFIVGRMYKVFVKKYWPQFVAAYNTAMDKLRDDKQLDKYKDTMSKGKDVDEEQKLKDQMDLLNPPKRH